MDATHLRAIWIDRALYKYLYYYYFTYLLFYLLLYTPSDDRLTTQRCFEPRHGVAKMVRLLCDFLKYN